jgi:hypothetical protein
MYQTHVGKKIISNQYWWHGSRIGSKHFARRQAKNGRRTPAMSEYSGEAFRKWSVWLRRNDGQVQGLNSGSLD